jgi:hypothetical protein
MATWWIKGSIVQSCNCSWGCPCNFQARPTHGDCEGGWVIHVEQGRVDDVDIAGLNFAIMADWPGAIHEGGGKAILLVDERGDEQQREALRKIGAGDIGGPFAVFLNTYSLESTTYAPFEVHIDGPRSHVRIGTAVQLDLESIRNPVTGAELSPMVVLPQGMLYSESVRYSSKVFRVTDGIAYEYSGTDAAVAPINWRGP